MRFSFYFISLLILMSCNGISQSSEESYDRVDNFDDYWFQGKAELTSYVLSQARYGELHEGEATLIFVTEPFNTRKQVKSDNGMGKNVASVLKLNQTRSFYTGIYPYSTMTSSFTPVENITPGNTLKVTNSVQEWCGQVFMQLNKKGNQYDIMSYSYFESEGDDRVQIGTSLLEDEIFSMIRLNPASLPEGEIQCFPSTVYLRFMHKDVRNYGAFAQKAKATWEGEEVHMYSVEYTDLGRMLKVYYTSEFPHEIVGWEEQYQVLKGKKLTTTAKKKDSKRIDYWNKNAVRDSIYRLR